MGISMKKEFRLLPAQHAFCQVNLDVYAFIHVRITEFNPYYQFNCKFLTLRNSACSSVCEEFKQIGEGWCATCALHMQQCKVLVLCLHAHASWHLTTSKLKVVVHGFYLAGEEIWKRSENQFDTWLLAVTSTFHQICLLFWLWVVDAVVIWDSMWVPNKCA